MQTSTDKPSFFGLGIAPSLLSRLEQLSFSEPTPIQQKAIPIAVTGEDLIGIAQTGTGKTLAFSIPMLQRIAATKRIGLVLLPTRELALQVEEELAKLAKPLGLRSAVLIGGASMPRQIRAVQSKPHVIIATPGRLNDHLQQKTISLANVGVLVLDEADRMLDMGFEPQIKRILATVPKERQTMLFSATMPAKIGNLARTYMQQPLRVEVAPSGTTAKLVDQELFVVPKNQKLDLLTALLTEYKGTVLVFSRTKHGAKKIARFVRGAEHTAAELHSNRSLSQRREALEGFKKGKYRILVATDIAARGIDVTGIELVLNFDLPDNSEDYVHRIGRTGRGGRKGKAISFVAPEQRRDVEAIERLIKIRLPITPLPHLEPTRSASMEQNRREYDEPRRGNRPPRSRSGGSGGSRSTYGKPSRPRNERSDRRDSDGPQKRKRRVHF